MRNEKLSIKLLQGDDASTYAAHTERNLLTSGIDGTPIFAVFPRNIEFDHQKEAERARSSWKLGVGQPGWKRSWGVFDGHDIVGEITLHSSRLTESQLHRAILEMGIEPRYRLCGLGKQLMSVALDWAKNETSLVWVDLGVFTHNAPARRLYERFGFIEVGRFVDLFRVEGQRVDDIQMTLHLRDYRGVAR